MISKLALQHFSLSEFIVGGMALATVAVVTLTDRRAVQPGYRLPSQLQGASHPPDLSSNRPQPQRPFDLPRLEITGSIAPPPSEPSGPGDTFGRSPLQAKESTEAPSTNSNIANATWSVAQLPKQPTETVNPPKPELNPENPSDAIWIQARLADLGYFIGSRSGFWGPASRRALRDFKTMNGLREDDRWDTETEQRLSSKQVIPAAETFIGGWAEDIAQCRDGAPLAISSHGAKVAGGECEFRFVKHEAATQWRAQAVCRDGGSSWNANVSLRLTAPKLIWSSERGTATYFRCARSRTSSASPEEIVTPPLIQSIGDWLQGVRKPVFVHE
jgi:hypothetical protein